MTETPSSCSCNFSPSRIQAFVKADPSYRLMKILQQLEDVEGLLHVLYRSACYESDSENERPIFELGIAEGGDMAAIAFASNSLRRIYEELGQIQAELPENRYFACPHTPSI